MTAIATETPTWSTTEVAHKLGLPHTTVWRWANALGYVDHGQGGGPGRGIRLTDADVATLHAWAALGVARCNGGRENALRLAIAAAFRREVGDYVVATPDLAVVCQTPEAAAAEAAQPWARSACTIVNVTGALL